MKHPDCHCPRTTHHHGNRVTYITHKCRCTPCTTANRNAERARSRAKLYGRYDRFLPGDLVRTHLRTLMNQGMGWKTISTRAGVATSTTYAILYGKHLAAPTHPEHRPPRIKVSRPVAEKLLAVTLTLAPSAVVPNVGTARRLQALMAIGYSGEYLARRLGMSRANIGPVIHATRDVTSATHAAVVGLYDDLWDQTPAARTSTKTRRLAARYGWVPPMAWDDDAMDNPDATPQAPEVGRSRRWHIEDAQWLLDSGMSAEAVAQQLGVEPATIEHGFRRAGLDGQPFAAAQARIERRAAA